MRKRWLMATGAVVVAAVAGIGIAQIVRPESGGAIPDALIERLRQGAVIEQYVAELVGTVRSADRDEDGLDQDDVALLQEIQAAQARASAVGQILPSDLNGDFKVTRDELVRAARGEEPYRSQQIDNQMARLDGDGDGAITLAEAVAGARTRAADRRIEEMLKLDPDGDGRLTAEEMRRMAERAFESVDRDRDGRISEDEYAVIAERVREAQMARSAPACDLPAVPGNARLVMFGAYESDAISSVAVGGPDQETNIIDVTIEPGGAPLYLVLTSYESMVWRIGGATGRVAQVVVSSQQDAPVKPVAVSSARRAGDRVAISPPPPLGSGGVSASGVTGLPAAKVMIADPQCPRYFSDSKGSQAATVIKRSTGRTPDAVFGRYSVRSVSLPSGTMVEAQRDGAPVPPGFDAASWTDAARFWPGGLVRVDPRQIVAKTRVEPYKVLPSQMGISQLIGAGAIVRTGDGDTFRVVRPIAHMPPSMGGAHSVTLILANGVPVPPGDPVHSCIIREETGRPIRPGARCALRGDRAPPRVTISRP